MTYRINSPSATAGGALAAGGAIALLCRDALVTGWTVDLALMPLLVGLTVLSGVLAARALRRAHVLPAIGLYALALLGSSLVVYETTGRRAEVRDTKVASAVDDGERRQHLTKMLNEAEDNVRKYRQRLSSECPTGKGTRCQGATYTVYTWEAAVTGYKSELAALGAPRPVDPKAERVAALAALAGVSTPAATVKASVGLIEPLALPLFLELGSILLFGYGLRQRAPAPASPPPRGVLACQPHDVPDATATDDSGVDVPARRLSRDEALADIRWLIQNGQTWPSQDWLLRRWGLPSTAKGTVSRWLKAWEAEGELGGNRYAVGRCKTVALRAVA